MKKLLLLTALACAVAPAAAAGQGGSSPRRSDPESIRMLHRYSACLAERRLEEARQVLAMDSRSHEYGVKIDSLGTRHHGCIRNGTLKMNRLLFAGGLAEALLRPALAGAALGPLVAYDPAKPPIVASDETEGMGLCAVRSMPDRVAKLLATEVASPDEARALGAITPDLGSCLRQGASAGFNATGLRAILALATYKLVRHNMAPVSASGS